MRTMRIILAGLVLSGCAHAKRDVQTVEPANPEVHYRWAKGTIVYAYYIEDDAVADASVESE